MFVISGVVVFRILHKIFDTLTDDENSRFKLFVFALVSMTSREFHCPAKPSTKTSDIHSVEQCIIFKPQNIII